MRALLLAAAIIAIAVPASADIGGNLILPPQGDQPAVRIKLLSFSWINKKYPGIRGFGGISERIVPKEGPATLIIVKSVAIAAPTLQGYCGKAPVPELQVDLPMWTRSDPEALQPIAHYVLKDVRVTDCRHAPGAPGEVYHLNFQSLEGPPPTEEWRQNAGN